MSRQPRYRQTFRAEIQTSTPPPVHIAHSLDVSAPSLPELPTTALNTFVQRAQGMGEILDLHISVRKLRSFEQ